MTSSNYFPDSDSRDCVNVTIDIIGDTTVRPARPLLRKLAEEERKKIEQWRKMKAEAESSPEQNEAESESSAEPETDEPTNPA